MFARNPLMLLVLLAAASVCQGQPMIVIDRMPSPAPISHLVVRQHQVRVTIERQVATTHIEQVFYNPCGIQLEGTLLFPLPHGAAIDRFSMDINGRDTEAELLDADKARSIYEDIVRRMRDPALLEYCQQGLLKARVFPIEPHSEKRVTLTYTHLLPADSGVVAYTYSITQRQVDGQPSGRVSMRIDLETDHPIANVYSPSHDVEIKRQSENKAVIGFESDALELGDFQLYYSTQEQDDPIALSLLTFRQGDEDGYFMLLASPSKALVDAPPQPKDIVFALDTSGSMAGEKLEQAKRALRFCLANLNDGDRFEIVRFSTDVEPLFGTLQPADKQHLKQARDFVDGLKPIGGTAIHDALVTAINTPSDDDDPRPRFVVFLTDGKPTIGQTDEETIVAAVRKAAGRTRVFCFGIGTEINTHLLDKVTESTRAASEYVLPEEDIEVKVSRFYTKIDRPVMTNPTLTIGTAPNARTAEPIRVSRMYPVDLPDLFSGDQLAIFGRYRGQGPAVVSLTGNVAGQAEDIRLSAVMPGEDVSHDFIPRLWAMRRVGYLLDEIRLRGEDRELRDEVVQLARDYGIVTPYTAYLIVEDEEARLVPALQRSVRNFDARSESRRLYNEMSQTKAGLSAARGARSNARLRSAQVAGAPIAAAEDVLGDRQAARAQQARFVQGRAFINDGHQWIDTRLQELTEFRPVQIVFNSDAYFDLLRRHPEAAAWLSVGRNVQVIIDGQVYEVVEKT